MSHLAKGGRTVKATAPSTLNEALGYLKLFPDHFIFPIEAKKKFPPRLKNYDALASNDLAQIRKWHKQYPGCSWGLAPIKSHVIVLDADLKPGKVGAASLEILQMLYEQLPATSIMRSPSLGRHYRFKATDKVQHKFRLDGFGEHLDSPHYVVIISTAGKYELENNLPLADAPDWFAEVLARPNDNAEPVEQTPVVELDTAANVEWAVHYLQHDAPPSIAGQGGENVTLLVAGVLKDHGISEFKAVELMGEHYNVAGKCEPLWSMGDCATEDSLPVKVRNAFTYLVQTAPGAATAQADFADDPPEPLTDVQKERDRKHRELNGGPPLDIISGDEIELRNIDWIWIAHLALGQHTCLAGVQGDGKSLFVYALIAAITTGGYWPGSDERAPLGNCVILSAEDTAKDVLGPRLVAAGADMKRVKIVKATRTDKGGRRKFNLQQDILKLQAAVRAIGNVKLITFDPISSYLGPDIDSHNNTELRDALDPITAMAEETGAAVVSITHFNKASKGVSALNRIMGSVAFTAAPRAAFVVLRDPNDDDKRLFLPVKANLMSFGDAYGMQFHIEKVDTGHRDKRNGNDNPILAPRVVWDEKVTMTADSVLNTAPSKRETPVLSSAVKYLIETLASGPMIVSEIRNDVEAMGAFSWHTVRRAHDTLKIISRKRLQPDGHGPYEWMLPEEVALGDESDFSS